ncbi:hypothetical protein [Egicoccus sp. AB-alg2]|uniref:hypothetical protein n=1 Tax=Egicoccus sp. AB-alg2 TaxID=3242693 RepID=UPI00359CC850
MASPALGAFARDFAGSAAATAWLLARGRLRLPGDHVGSDLLFADGTRSRVYRETVVAPAVTRRPALLVVRFRLRLVGTNPTLHALFRAESIANTPLFAGFPGFRSKLWCTDLDTGVYRGVYGWDGADLATDYATTLSALLRVVSEAGSVDFHAVADVHRDAYLRDPALAGDPGPGHAWWRLAQPLAA